MRRRADLQGTMIDLRYVKKLIEILDESTVDSIEISSDKGMKIRLSKSPQQRGAVQMAAPVPMPAMLPASPMRATPAEGMPTVAEAPPAAPAKSSLLEVKSPMVGTFYSAPEPGAKPFAGVGARVSKGQVLCIIEAMKLMNEITADADGEVMKCYVENGQAVQYGERLFAIKPAHV